MTGCGETPFCAKKILTIVTMCACLMLAAESALAESPADEGTRDLAALLAEQNTTLSRELRRIQREIAALRADLDKPGLGDVFGGIGYIFGIFGTAAFVAAGAGTGALIEITIRMDQSKDQRCTFPTGFSPSP